MTYELIITEKPNAAKMIAQALADGKPIKESINGVPYYKVTRGKKDLVIGCAVGHLYTVAEKEKSFKYPVFDLQWRANADVMKKDFSKKYLNVLIKLAKDAKEFTVATDYDIEGEVIGFNVIRYACKQKDAARMKFSTLTKSDLIEAYENKSKSIDWGQAYAGETRHFLDWIYGINLSRALTTAIKNAGMFKILSSGRVQGPALKMVVEKEEEIAAFKSEPYWQISVKGQLKDTELEVWHEKDKFTNEQEVKDIVKKITGKDGKVEKIQNSEFVQKPPVPFDLTTLQTEAYKFFGIKPKQTLDIAQDLYSSGYISYPRTSSQKLPNVNFKKLLEQLSKYDKNASELLKGELKPTEGKKTDPAHPAIYPTGLIPKLADRNAKIYDLIVKRFLACFSDDAKRETVTIYIDIASEKFLARGTRTRYPGWHKYYAPYVQLEDKEMPKCKNNDPFKNKETIKYDKETQPPKRYTPASIIRELEKRDLGTKATRASIVDSLYDRNYVKNDSIEATELGIQTVATLGKFAPEILDTKLTRHFELEMEKIREKKLTEEKVLKEAENALVKILDKFKKNEKSIGKELTETYRQHLETESYIGKCPKCKTGNLKIMYSKKSKRKFIACDNEDCKTIMNMPGYNVKSVDKVCDKCQFPIVKVLAGRMTRELCINPECPGKKTQDKTVLKEINAIESGKTEVECPKCGQPLMVRKSVYGQFLGCSTFPKCRYTEKIPKDDEERAQVEKRREYFGQNKTSDRYDHRWLAKKAKEENTNKKNAKGVKETAEKEKKPIKNPKKKN
jgi:DNA topoisomerase-1